MGVFELETYMRTSLKGGVKDVSVKEAIEDFRKMNDFLMKPILVFDVTSIVTLLSKNKSEILCGGRHQIYKEILDDLFSRLSNDAELVFFLDGSIKETKFNTWAARQNQKYLNNLKLMSQIYNEISLSFLVKNRHEIYTNTLLSAIEASCQQFGQLNYAVTLECDQELAQFAYTNRRVLAVFSNDSDFLIFPGQWRYWSTKDLNLSALTTKEFDRQELQKSLKLNNFQLSIFATLAGNDIVPQSDLQKFHVNFGYRVQKRFPALAKYIRKNFTSKTNHTEVLQFLSQEIYGKVFKESLSRLNSSINSYRIVFKKTEEEANQSPPISSYLINHNLFTYNVLSGSPINFSLVFVDLRKKDMPSYYDLAVPMFQRQAGIVLIHSGMTNVNPRIYVKSSHHSKYHQKTVQPSFPPFDVPLLDELLSDDPQFDEERFNLLKWTMSWGEHLKNFPIQELRANYMIDILTLAYMKHQGVITDKEGDVFLWTIKNVENNLITKGLKPPEVLDPRAFRLAFIYVRMFANVARSIEVCGLKKRYWKPLNFDGVFFHNEYHRFKHTEFDTYALLNQL